ncbi:hypothetical protein FMM56_01105 [Campylobacter sp. LR264d]|uniref:hypothetical protein n=1 Tax=Campylobacter sp. LR264d TaxID=2593544 RepID=UPI001238BDF0|nr:hypothetical protein [Campylobacter sp. LR264d]KAA6234165.1 hypothetical protein FMM56_01105 [Campylobacter sp. LR264d]
MRNQIENMSDEELLQMIRNKRKNDFVDEEYESSIDDINGYGYEEHNLDYYKKEYKKQKIKVYRFEIYFEIVKIIKVKRIRTYSELLEILKEEYDDYYADLISDFKLRDLVFRLYVKQNQLKKEVFNEVEELNKLKNFLDEKGFNCKITKVKQDYKQYYYSFFNLDYANNEMPDYILCSDEKLSFECQAVRHDCFHIVIFSVINYISDIFAENNDFIDEPYYYHKLSKEEILEKLQRVMKIIYQD